MWISSPLGEHVGLTTPRISPAVAGHLETHTGTTSVDSFGDEFVADLGDIGSAFTLHVTSVGAVLTQRTDGDRCVLDLANDVVVDVGLVISPTTHKDVTHIDLGHG